MSALRILLLSQWFDPGATLRLKGENYIPAEYGHMVPSTAKFLDEDGKTISRERALNIKEAKVVENGEPGTDGAEDEKRKEAEDDAKKREGPHSNVLTPASAVKPSDTTQVVKTPPAAATKLA